MRFTWLGLALVSACASNGSNATGDPGGGGTVSFGGAQDIGQFRDILDQGGVPGPDTLDANGFFNEHYNAAPAASCGQALCLVPGLAVGRDWLTNAHQATLELAIESTVDPTTYHRLPMNLVIVVDHSGSMASDGRIDKVRSGLTTLIDNLQDDDRLSIVAFDDTVNVLAPFGETLDRASLHAIVDALQPDGGTDIFDGLQTGFQQFGDAPSGDHQNRVIFLSDGLATSGDTTQTDILAMADGFISRGIGLTTVGVGNEFDVQLMRGLAEHGAGNFYFLESEQAANEVFTEELDFFVNPIAYDLQIDVTAGSGYQLGDPVGSSLWTEGTNSGQMSVPAVFLASRTSQAGEVGRRGGGSMIFVQLLPQGHDGGRVADLTLSYQLPGSPERIEQTVSLDYTGDPEETPATPYLSSPEMAERLAMYNEFLGLRLATGTLQPGCALGTLASTRAGAAAYNATANDPDITADLALIDEYIANLKTVDDVSSTTTLTCNTDPYTPPAYGEDDPYQPMECSAGGSPGGWLVIVLAAMLPIRRRNCKVRLAGPRSTAEGRCEV
jgi:Ca-activated chloride channel homolog